MNRDREELFGLDRRKAIVTVVAAVAILAAAVFLIGQVASFSKMLHALREADRKWFVVCLLGELVAYAGYIAAYRDIARVDGGPRLPVWTVTRVVAVGFGAFIAGSSFGTLGVDYWALHKAGEQPHRAVRRVLALNTLQWGVLAAAAAVSGGVLLVFHRHSAPLAMQIAWLAIVPACVLAAAWVSSPKRAPRFTALPKVAHARLGRAPSTWLRWLRTVGRLALADAIGGVVLVRHVLLRPRRYPLALLGFPIFWAGDVLTLYAGIRAFGADVGLLGLVLAYTTAYVVTSLPLPAGGAGGVEAGLAFSLEAVGVPLASALLATLVYRFFTLWLPIAISAVAVTQLDELAEELPLVEREPAAG
ncbi:MAG: putative heme transporter [Gaiellaceae bacterium]|nr:putative heme transporter [Gaiellaceae bacterium]MDX6470920.1 putative heme transporter [Gaiellaceae bacterium]